MSGHFEHYILSFYTIFIVLNIILDFVLFLSCMAGGAIVHAVRVRVRTRARSNKDTRVTGSSSNLHSSRLYYKQSVI